MGIREVETRGAYIVTVIEKKKNKKTKKQKTKNQRHCEFGLHGRLISTALRLEYA